MLPRRVLGSVTARSPPAVEEMVRSEIMDERFDFEEVFDFREKRRVAMGLVLDLDSVGDMASFWRGAVFFVDLILDLSDLRWNFASIASL